MRIALECLPPCLPAADRNVTSSFPIWKQQMVAPPPLRRGAKKGDRRRAIRTLMTPACPHRQGNSPVRTTTPYYGQGGNHRRVACPTSLAESLQAYSFRHHLPVASTSSPLADFEFTRSSPRPLRRPGWRRGSIPTYSATQIPSSGYVKPETRGVTDPPRACQPLLTLQEEGFLRIQQGVQFD